MVQAVHTQAPSAEALEEASHQRQSALSACAALEDVAPASPEDGHAGAPEGTEVAPAQHLWHPPATGPRAEELTIRRADTG